MLASSSDLARLIELVAVQDRRAFKQLYVLTNAKLYGVVLRILDNRSDADEILQEIYIKIWSSAARYRRTQCSPISWLVVVARNMSIDAIRKRRVVCRDLDGVERICDLAPSPEQAAIASDQSRRLGASLSNLPFRSAKLLRGAYFDGNSYSELAVRYDVPLNTVRTWLRRGLIELNKQMVIEALESAV